MSKPTFKEAWKRWRNKGKGKSFTPEDITIFTLISLAISGIIHSISHFFMDKVLHWIWGGKKK